MEKSIAIIYPSLGGGMVRHAKDMIASWSQNELTILGIKLQRRIITIEVRKKGIVIDNYNFPLNNDELLIKICQYYGVKLIHYHHIYNIPRKVMNLFEILGVPMAITLHDYFFVCPFINLTDDNIYCGEHGIKECNECIRKNVNKLMEKKIDILEWREEKYTFLKKAFKIIVPHEDVKRRYLKYFPDLKINVISNPELINIDTRALKSKKNRDSKKIKIGILGHITPIKGAKKIVQCLRLAKKNNLNICFELFGEIEDGTSFDKYEDIFIIHGKYDEQSIYKEIAERNIDFFWFPAVLPETYSYTLTIPIRLKIPVVGCNLGAIGCRIVENKWGEVYDWNAPANKILDILLNFKYIDYRGGDNFSVNNTTFLPIKNYYGNTEFMNRPTLSNENNTKNILHVLEKKYCDNVRLDNLRGVEIKWLMKNGGINSIKILLFNIDWKWMLKMIFKMN